MSTFYISTPIYYVNGAPHIGHAYTNVVADALARYARQRGDEVFFMTGTDEHGLKIQRAAEQRGISPQQLADETSAQFRDLFTRLELTHDRFIRTTEAEHKRVVQQIVARMIARGDVYLDTYEGWYAASDEAFYDESEIEDGKAKASGAAVEWVKEQSYFFRLSAYQQPLLDWYAAHPEAVQPDGRRNEVSAFVAGGLRDLSISRTTFSWGIPMQEDPAHVLYVWVDALTNYISGLGGFEDSAAYDKFWPCDLHLIGKDILRFHAVYWPAFLMSAGLTPPKQILAHGWWLNDGVKMSKSLGNFIDAFELVEQYPLDVLRYYLLREIALGQDGNFVADRLAERNNGELADNFGNLVNRAMTMAQRFIGTIPQHGTLTEEDQALVERATRAVAEVEAHFEAREPHKMLESILGLSSALNLYLQQMQPWKLAKDPAQRERLEQVLYNTLEGIRWVAVLMAPFTPNAARATLEGLGLTGPEALRLDGLRWGGLQAGGAINPPPVLFAKLELASAAATAAAATERAPEPKAKAGAKAHPTPAQAAEGASATSLLDFKAFQAIELRVGLVVEAQAVPGSEKLLKLTVDVGEDAPRTVVSGIAKSFAPEALTGGRFAFVTNLKPAKLFGIRSEAMLLATDRPDGTLELARFSDAIPAGQRIS